LTLAMKALAALTLLSLFAALHAPFVAAVSPTGMECCPDGMPGVCCPVSGSCSLRSCGASEREAQASTMSAFIVPLSVVAITTGISSLAPAGTESLLSSRASRVPDPPPRG
jgi:hypothetical protein